MTAVPVRAAAPPGWREAPAPAARWGRDPNGGDAQADAGGASTSATAAEFSISSGMGVRLALGTAVGATALLGLYWASRRFHTAHHIPAAYFERQRFLTGRVVAVNDGDGFRMVHTPLLGFFRSTAPDKRTYPARRRPTGPPSFQLTVRRVVRCLPCVAASGVAPRADQAQHQRAALGRRRSRGAARTRRACALQAGPPYL